MSWQVASFALLALALLAGFVWYERSHPSARVLALVGTLAALAVLGRIAFAAVPNVKPTTDIVLLRRLRLRRRARLRGRLGRGAGVELLLHAGPVDAVADGGVGQRSASSARRSRGSAAAGWGGCRSRSPAASAGSPSARSSTSAASSRSATRTCGRASSPTSRRRCRGTSSHAAGNVAFFLLFGPALIRILRRFRTRFAFTWRAAPVTRARPRLPAAPATSATRRGLVALALAAVIAGCLTAPAPQRPDAADKTPGRLPARRPEPRRRLRRRARPALGRPLHRLGRARPRRQGPQSRRRQARRSGRSLLDYTRAHARALDRRRIADRRPGRRPRAHDHGASPPQRQDPRAFAGQDLVAALRAQVTGKDGVLEQSNLTAFAILALRSRRRPRARRRPDAPPPPGSPASRTATAAGRSRRRAAAPTSTTAPRRCRRCSPPAAGRDQSDRRGARLPAPPAEPRRRLPAAAGLLLERAVDRLGAAGVRGRGRQAAAGPSRKRRRRSALAYLQIADRPERHGPVLAHEPPDAGVDDRDRARRARRRKLPAHAGRARRRRRPRSAAVEPRRSCRRASRRRRRRPARRSP